nr:hypothetical protein [uncultured Sphaerochaeta sp.]
MIRRFILVSTILLFLFIGCENNPSSDSNEITVTPSNLLVADTSHKSSGTSSVDIWFSPPEDLGATSYTLQTSADGVTWEDFVYYAEVLQTSKGDQDNFSVNLGSDCHVRLKITGGTYDGQYSNSMFAPHAYDPYYFRSTTLDESLGNTGVMMPNVGYGLWASFTVWAVADSSVLEDGLTYQWYRVKADDFDQTMLIPGATSLEYTTTETDRGHFIMIEALGKAGVFDGGMRRLVSTEAVK